MILNRNVLRRFINQRVGHVIVLLRRHGVKVRQGSTNHDQITRSATNVTRTRRLVRQTFQVSSTTTLQDLIRIPMDKGRNILRNAISSVKHSITLRQYVSSTRKNVTIRARAINQDVARATSNNANLHANGTRQRMARHRGVFLAINRDLLRNLITFRRRDITARSIIRAILSSLNVSRFASAITYRSTVSRDLRHANQTLLRPPMNLLINQRARKSKVRMVIRINVKHSRRLMATRRQARVMRRLYVQFIRNSVRCLITLIGLNQSRRKAMVRQEVCLIRRVSRAITHRMFHFGITLFRVRFVTNLILRSIRIIKGHAGREVGLIILRGINRSIIKRVIPDTRALRPIFTFATGTRRIISDFIKKRRRRARIALRDKFKEVSTARATLMNVPNQIGMRANVTLIITLLIRFRYTMSNRIAKFTILKVFIRVTRNVSDQFLNHHVAMNRKGNGTIRRFTRLPNATINVSRSNRNLK